MKTKAFDCVEMKHRGAERLAARIKAMSVEEELEFWRRETEALRRFQRKAVSSDGTKEPS